MAVLSVVLGTLTWYLRPIVEFNETRTRILELGVQKDNRNFGFDVVVDGSPHLGAAGVEFVGLGATTVTDTALERLKEHLEKLPNLEGLDLGDNTQITDAGLKHIGGLTNLKMLGLQQTQITDTGLVHLKGLTNLETLQLGSTQVTDAGLERLKELTSLQRLTLENNAGITDAGLEHLRGLTNLRELHVGATQVNDEGVRKLQQALPKCRISR